MTPSATTAAIGASMWESSPLLHLARTVHRNRRGQPMSFRSRPYLIPLYAELGTYRGEVVHMKGVQLGLTELLITLAVHHAGWRDRIVAYALPTFDVRNRFVGERVDPILSRVPAYNERLPGEAYGPPEKGGTSLKRKRMGMHGSILFLGSNTESDFIELSADTALIDEYDNCDWSNLAKVKDRVREGRDPLILWASNPRRVGGIEAKYRDGTQSQWFHRCGRCGERQPLDWENNFVRRSDSGQWVPRDTERAGDRTMGDLRPTCRRCEKPFDRGEKGCWVDKFEADVWSLHNSRFDRLATPHDPQPIRGYFVEWLLAQGDTAKLTAFWAGVSGLLYSPRGSQVTQSMIEAVATGPVIDYVGGPQYAEPVVVMGVDVGSVLNVQIDVVEWVEPDIPEDSDVDLGEDVVPPEPQPHRRTAWVGVVVDFEDLHEMFRRYHVDVAVIDADPETRKCKELVERADREGHTQVWMCRFFAVARVGRNTFGMLPKPKESLVHVDRTMVFDATMDDFLEGRHELPKDVKTVNAYVEQTRAPVRQLNDKGRWIWDEAGKADHYRLSDVYARVAAEIYGAGGQVY